MKKLVILAAAVVGVAFSAACSSDTVADPTAAIEVDLTTNNTFSPASVTVKVGQTVRWVWQGGSHNVVSGTKSGEVCTEDGNFKSGSPVAGGTYDKKFEVAGTFPYYCEPHCAVGMTGTVIVTE